MDNTAAEHQQVFEGIVTSVVYVGEFSGRAFQIATFNAAYVVTVHVAQTDNPDGPVKVGEQHFIVHSPTHTLRSGRDAIGRNARLRLTYETQGDTIRPIYLEPA